MKTLRHPAESRKRVVISILLVLFCTLTFGLGLVVVVCALAYVYWRYWQIIREGKKRWVELTPVLDSDLYQLVEEIKGRLDVPASVTVYVDPYNEPAHPFASTFGKSYIVLNYSRIKTLEQSKDHDRHIQVAFLVGHEFGHYLLKHPRWFVTLDRMDKGTGVLQKKNLLVSALIAIVTGYKRACELSADRCGFYASGRNVDACKKVLAKVFAHKKKVGSREYRKLQEENDRLENILTNLNDAYPLPADRLEELVNDR